MNILTFLTLALYFIASLAEEHPIIETKNGLVKGVYRTSFDGRKFSAFEGIPFAKPPLGELRFKEPKPMTPWTGTWEANTKYVCAQLNMFQHTFEGDEDCLYINVYVPREKPDSSDSFDVIVHIHGGAFMVGHAHALIGPEYLMDRDVVFVTFNYRLGPFGFLSTRDDALPGNYGLKDQTLALKWIQENIDKFGGNPKSVTLTGLSAGGASVHYHYISPLSKGLFHRGLSQSGSVLLPWALQKAPVEKAKKLAAVLGCYDESSGNIAKCLRQRSTQQIVEGLKEFYTKLFLPLAPFGPTIELNPVNAFLPNHPYHLLHKAIANDVPWITSVTTHEGLFPTVLYLDKLDYLEQNWVDVAPLLLEFNDTVSSTKKPELSARIKQFYFKDKPISRDNVQTLVQIVTERIFTIDTEKAARVQAKSGKSPVFILMVGYKGQNTLTKMFTQENIEGVSHGDDAFFYLFPALPNSELTPPEEKMKNLYVDMLVDYANTGVPKFGDVEWTPVSDDEEISYLLIKDPDNIKVEKTGELGGTEFWKLAALRENENIVLFSGSSEESPAESKSSPEESISEEKDEL